MAGASQQSRTIESIISGVCGNFLKNSFLNVMRDSDELADAKPEEETATFHKCLKALHLTVSLASQAHTTWWVVGDFITRNDNRFPVTSYLLRSSFLTM